MTAPSCTGRIPRRGAAGTVEILGLAEPALRDAMHEGFSRFRCEELVLRPFRRAPKSWQNGPLAMPMLRSPMPVSRHCRSCRDMLRRAGRAPGFPQLKLLRFRVGDAFRLHVTKPTYGLGKRCELHGGFIVMRLEVPEGLGDQTLVICNQLPLDATLPRPTERVKHRATQAPRAGKEPENRQHPGPE
jgi:hypothetical protein